MAKLIKLEFRTLRYKIDSRKRISMSSGGKTIFPKNRHMRFLNFYLGVWDSKLKTFAPKDVVKTEVASYGELTGTPQQIVRQLLTMQPPVMPKMDSQDAAENRRQWEQFQEMLKTYRASVGRVDDFLKVVRFGAEDRFRFKLYEFDGACKRLFGMYRPINASARGYKATMNEAMFGITYYIKRYKNLYGSMRSYVGKSRSVHGYDFGQIYTPYIKKLRAEVRATNGKMLIKALITFYDNGKRLVYKAREPKGVTRKWRP